MIAPDASGSRGNDLWVKKYVGTFPQGIWQHVAPIPNHPMDADIDCSGTQFPAKFALAGDFDGDGRAELLIAPDASGSRGNDLWVMKYVGTFPQGVWRHMAPIPNHPMGADIDCSGDQFPAKFAVVGDFDGDGSDEVMIAPDASGSRGNDLWVMKHVPSKFAPGRWQHMASIPDHPMDADIDCSADQLPARFAVVADFDRDGAHELVVAPDYRSISFPPAFSFLWAMKYFGTFPGGAFDHMEPPESAPDNVDAFLSTTVWSAEAALVGAFDGQGPELLVGPDFKDPDFGPTEIFFWALGFDLASPARSSAPDRLDIFALSVDNDMLSLAIDGRASISCICSSAPYKTRPLWRAWLSLWAPRRSTASLPGLASTRSMGHLVCLCS